MKISKQFLIVATAILVLTKISAFVAAILFILAECLTLPESKLLACFILASVCICFIFTEILRIYLDDFEEE